MAWSNYDILPNIVFDCLQFAFRTLDAIAPNKVNRRFSIDVVIHVP